tara:strand:+ start:7697 stop:8683 length:987 start_codon:yes stop_codon:yes gene_type:complete
MADKSKLEQMLEKLVNNDREGADSLFHEFVIDKSRGIYEKMLEDEMTDLEVDEGSYKDKKKKDDKMKEESDEEVDEASDDDEVKEESDEEVDEASDEDVEEATDKEVEENFGITPEADPMGGDAADDMIDDMEAGDDEGGDEMGGDDAEEIEDRVVDLEDALDDLKAEFEKMMSDKGDDGEDDMDDDDAADMDMDDEEKEEAFEPTSELSMEQPDEMPFEGTKSQAEQMREYVEKVAMPKGEDNKAKSPVAGANKMGGTASNLNAGGESDSKGTAGGLAGNTPKEDNAGNVNVPGGKASKSMKNAKGHGAEKKGAGETGTDAKSIIGS